ncbi:TPR repeat-containing protein [Pirellula staleyi DSM 6068]|uniref:TPR repeat-containing protein n=1 Tax=Pirellula staleyi (strain ATCC 27377 / DSM 6068 / ICPB 4128) TaxID=530564 RepID=D2R5Y5_PIRSD|nr:tetratricopeptide repeat protein [Pirellula staleyi]ADB19070.1 TPR repeat-containing protein [Pirellula staleyi DSM 6068]
MSISESILDEKLLELNRLMDRGLYLQMYAHTRELGPLQTWTGPRAGVLASRLANHLGAHSLSRWIIRRLLREFPSDSEVRYYSTYLEIGRLGPYRTWRNLQANLELESDASDETRSSWYALIGQVAATFRDFETSEKWLRRASDVAPENPWISVCWSYVLEMQDRYDEALAQAQRSLEIRPMYRAGVQAAGHLLSLANRDTEAIELYDAALEVIESSAVAAHLFAIHLELRDWSRAKQALDRFEQFCPLAQRSTRRWIAANRSEIAYQMGDIETAIAEAELARTPYLKQIVENLRATESSGGSKVFLDVPFVRQHHVTCAPATLAAISRYWSKPAEHVQVASEICYNGTTTHAERTWAEASGWVVKEFSVTAESAQQLLDRGIPFTLVTIEPGNAHLQAIIGYDQRRKTLTIRDPYYRNLGETLCEKFLDRYRAFGPRGMALVPQEMAEKISDLTLPDEALWNGLFELDGALIKHDRAQAEVVYQAMCTSAPDDRLTLEARRRLAIYDANPAEQLAAVEKVFEQFPTSERIAWERLALLRYQTSREQRLQQLEAMAQREDASPIFSRMLADELLQDARRHADATTLLRKSIRRWPTDPSSYHSLGNLLWDARKNEEALELFRFASCLGDKDEHFARSYFQASTWMRRTDELVTLLRDRVERYGRKSTDPAKTLASALFQLNRHAEGLTVLEQAIEKHPADGALRLYAANAHLTASNDFLPRAIALVEEAKAISPRDEFLRSSAMLASATGDSQRALALWQELAVMQPYSIDAHHAVARLLAIIEGPTAPLVYLEQICAKLPHYYPVHELRIQWLRDEPSEVREPVLAHVLTISPDDAWVRREMAAVLGSLKRFEEAHAQLDIAEKIEPFSPSYWMVRGILLRTEGRLDEAKTAFRRSIELAVDSDFAIESLMGMCTTLAERREVLRFVREQLVSQVTQGVGLSAFAHAAQGILEPEELLAELQAARVARPDLAEAWSSVTEQLAQLERFDDALANAQQACERFPLSILLWTDLARVHRLRLDFDSESEALANALRLDPGHSTALEMMCEALARKRDLQAACDLAKRATAHASLDYLNHTILAEQWWQLKEHDRAIEALRQAIRIEPGADRAWGNLQQWAKDLGQPEIAIDIARTLTQSRPGEARSWHVLARILDGPQHSDESLAAIERAIELNPLGIDLHDLHADILAEQGRLREASLACQPAVFGDLQPSKLAIRQSIIDATRGDLLAAIARVRTVLVEEPHNYRAWMLLGDWTKAINDFDGFLEVAENLARLSPNYEYSLYTLGDARLLKGDRQGAKEAFARAFELVPYHEHLGNNLFDLHFEDDEFETAAAVIAVLREHSSSCFVVTRELQVAFQQDRSDRARELLAELCTAKYESDWPITTAGQLFIEAGMIDDAIGVLRQAIELPSAHAQVAAWWARLEFWKANLDHWTPVQSRLEVLDRIPSTKEFLQAWYEAAAELEWRGDIEGFSRAAEVLETLDSDNALARYFSGSAAAFREENDRAIEALRLALAIDPKHAPSKSKLLDIYLAQGDTAQAKELLDSFDGENPSADIVARKVEWSALSGDSAAAQELLQSICQLHSDNQHATGHAIRALERNKMSTIAETVLLEMLDSPRVEQFHVDEFSRLVLARDSSALLPILETRLAQPVVGDRMLRHWIVELICTGRGAELRDFAHRYHSTIVSNYRLWARVCWGSLEDRNFDFTAEVALDWRNYPQAEAWMLLPAAEVLRHLGRHSEAMQVHETAMRLGSSNGRNAHHVWVGIDDAINGRYAEAKQHALHLHPNDGLDHSERFIKTLLLSILEMADAPPDKRIQVFREVEQRIQRDILDCSYTTTHYLHENERKRLFEAATRRIAQLAGNHNSVGWRISLFVNRILRFISRLLKKGYARF